MYDIDNLDYFTEGQTGFIPLEFTDEEGASIIPSSLTCTIHDLVSGEVLMEEVLSPEEAGITIEITPSANRIVNPERKREVHVLTVIGAYGAGKMTTAEYRFVVVNLAFHAVEGE